MKGNGLNLCGLTFRYPSYDGRETPPLFQGLDYSLGAGESAVLLAGADAGKTTLARIISGLVPRFTGGKREGRLWFGCRDLGSSKPFANVDLIGIVSQDSDEQIFSTRCDTEVAFALESLGVPRTEIESRVSSALALMGLSGLEGRNPTTLSGGEKKRLLLGCLLAVDPALWILDEAFEELDMYWKKTVVRHLREQGKTALILDSRWSSLYASTCEVFSVLQGGKIQDAESGPDAPRFRTALENGGLVIPRGAASVGKEREAGRREFLRAEKIFFRFPRGTFSLRVGSLRLEKGEIASLVGRNGSGKSTLGRILCGLLVPDEGCVSLFAAGGARSPAQPRELSHQIGYLFQNPDYQIHQPTVFDELAYGLLLRGLGKDTARELVEGAIRIFRLPDSNTPPALMSYGARKRLQAATYYLLGREFLILDEMDSGLSYNEFFPILEALTARGAGVMMITHDLDLARAVSSRILLMEDGQIRVDRGRKDFHMLEAFLAGKGQGGGH
jgi:energy-coupling factor transporter ATP-binding protein EcfA2